MDGGAIGGFTSTCHITGDTHERSHAGVAYLATVLSRKNLTVTTGALVLKVLIESNEAGEDVASGVVCSKSSVVTTVRASREVILTAEVFETPHLLELSGIGNPEILSSYGIEVRHANPAVGENLQDHLKACISLEAAEGGEAWDPDTANNCKARHLYEKDRSGPWADKAAFSFAHMPLVPFFQPSELQSLFDEHLEDEPSPFLEKRNAFIQSMATSPDESTVTALPIRNPGPGIKGDGNHITLNTMLSHPFSRGSVHLIRPDASINPSIDFRYYSYPLDLPLRALHLQVLYKLAKTQPLASFIKKNGSSKYPAVESDLTALKDVISDTAMTNYHPCGTASMMA